METIDKAIKLCEMKAEQTDPCRHHWQRGSS